MPRKRSSGDASLDDAEDLDDTGSSPLKETPSKELAKEDGIVNARKKLDLESPEDGSSANGENLQTNNSPLVPPPPPEYIKTKGKNKMRKTAASENSMASSADSLEEDRRAQ